MALVITIDGVTTAIDEGTLDLAMVANGIDRLSCAVSSADGSVRPEMDDPVTVSKDGTTLFGGLIDTPSEAGFMGDGLTAITTRIDALDYNQLPGFRLVTGTFPGGSLEDWLTWILPYLTPYGVTLDPAQATGPTIPELVYDDTSLATAFADVERLSGWTRDIDASKVLGMYEPGTVAAPFNILDGDGHIDGDLTIEPSRESYANRVILKFTEQARAAYAFLRTTGNFSNGETAVVGGKTYTFEAVLTDVDGHVQIGGDAEASLNNLAAAITLGGTPGTDYAASMTLNAQVTAYWQAADMMKAVALTAGAAGNSIGCTHTCAAADWVTEGNVPTVTLTFGADAALTNRVQAPDPATEPTAEQTAHGLREVSVSKADCYDTATAESLAAAELAWRIASVASTARYATYTDGLRPGQTQTINSAIRHVNASFLITEVRVRDVFSKLRYEVTAVEGTAVLGTFRDDYQAWAGPSSSSASASVSGGVVVASKWRLYPLGSGAADQSPTPTWITPSPVRAAIDTASGGSTVATVTLRVRALDAGVSVRARLYNATTAAAAGEQVTAVTSTAWTLVSFSVALAAGLNEYEIQLLPGTANADVAYAGAYVEWES